MSACALQAETLDVRTTLRNYLKKLSKVDVARFKGKGRRSKSQGLGSKVDCSPSIDSREVRYAGIFFSLRVTALTVHGGHTTRPRTIGQTVISFIK